jgi:hypothetical protein
MGGLHNGAAPRLGFRVATENEFHFQDADAILTLHAAEAH